MQMVQANSQLALVHSLLVNLMCNKAMFVQFIHNTDDDSLILILISDFIRFKIREVRLNEVDEPIWHMIYKRFGGSNQ